VGLRQSAGDAGRAIFRIWSSTRDARCSAACHTDARTARIAGARVTNIAIDNAAGNSGFAGACATITCSTTTGADHQRGKADRRFRWTGDVSVE
jgi:hypothetical protein